MFSIIQTGWGGKKYSRNGINGNSAKKASKEP